MMCSLPSTLPLLTRILYFFPMLVITFACNLYMFGSNHGGSPLPPLIRPLELPVFSTTNKFRFDHPWFWKTFLRSVMDMCRAHKKSADLTNVFTTNFGQSRLSNDDLSDYHILKARARGEFIQTPTGLQGPPLDQQDRAKMESFRTREERYQQENINKREAVDTVIQIIISMLPENIVVDPAIANCRNQQQQDDFALRWHTFIQLIEARLFNHGAVGATHSYLYQLLGLSFRVETPTHLTMFGHRLAAIQQLHTDNNQPIIPEFDLKRRLSDASRQLPIQHTGIATQIQNYYSDPTKTFNDQMSYLDNQSAYGTIVTNQPTSLNQQSYANMTSMETDEPYDSQTTHASHATTQNRLAIRGNQHQNQHQHNTTSSILDEHQLNSIITAVLSRTTCHLWARKGYCPVDHTNTRHYAEFDHSITTRGMGKQNVLFERACEDMEVRWQQSLQESQSQQTQPQSRGRSGTPFDQPRRSSSRDRANNSDHRSRSRSNDRGSKPRSR